MSRKPFKLRSQSAVKTSGFKMMGASPYKQDDAGGGSAGGGEVITTGGNEEEEEEKENKLGQAAQTGAKGVKKIFNKATDALSAGLAAVYGGKGANRAGGAGGGKSVKITKEKDEVQSGSPEENIEKLSTVDNPEQKGPPPPQETQTQQPYTIQKGDTLSQLAQTHNTTVDDLMEKNPNITDPDKIYAGEDLNL
jgi:LysM repeat protein